MRKLFLCALCAAACLLTAAQLAFAQPWSCPAGYRLCSSRTGQPACCRGNPGARSGAGTVFQRGPSGGGAAVGTGVGAARGAAGVIGGQGGGDGSGGGGSGGGY